MRLAELEAREDAWRILQRTLEAAWSLQLGEPVHVTDGRRRGAQRWLVQGLLSAIYTPDVGRRGRRFMADGFRYTRVRWRAAPQWVLGTALGSRLGLRGTSARSFWVTPPIPRARDLVLVPGNRRLRSFDFGRGLTRAVTKAGFPPDALSREIAVRGSGRAGPFVPLTDWDARAGWMEEPIVPGLPLSRWPVWRPIAPVERQAFAALEGWLAPTTIERTADSYLAELGGWIHRLLGRIDAQRDPTTAEALPRFVERLGEAAAPLERVELAESHGDFQPGNIHVRRGGRGVLLCDWEYSGMRSAAYDALTYVLRLRSPAGLRERAAAWLAWQPCALPARADVPDPARRAAVLALVLLEDLARLLDEAAGAPFRDAFWSTRQLLGETRHLPLGGGHA